MPSSRYSDEILAIVTALEWSTPPASSVLRVALYGGMYQDPANPSAEAVYYDGRIKSDLLLDRKIGVVFWKENSELDFGYLDLANEDQDDTLTNFIENVHAASVELYRVNKTDITADQIQLIATAHTSDIAYASESTIRFRLESSLQPALDAPINELYYDDTYIEHEGKPYPMAWGKILEIHQLLPTFFVDPIYLLYHVTDLEISSFDSAIYDRGVALAESVEFTAADYGFNLLQNPDGKITAGRLTLIDPEDTGNEFLGLYRFMRLAMTRTGVWANADQAELLALEATINMGPVYPIYCDSGCFFAGLHGSNVRRRSKLVLHLRATLNPFRPTH